MGGGGTEVEPKYFVRGEPSLASVERLRVEVDLPGVKSGKEVMLMETFIEYMEWLSSHIHRWLLTLERTGWLCAAQS